MCHASPFFISKRMLLSFEYKRSSYFAIVLYGLYNDDAN